MSLRSKDNQKVNLRHFTIETGGSVGPESEPGITSGFRVRADASDAKYPIIYGCGHPYKEYYGVTGFPGVAPVFERRGKNQPLIVNGIVRAISVKKVVAEEMLSADHQSIGSRYRAEAPIDGEMGSLAFLTLINHSSDSSSKIERSADAGRVSGVTRGRLLSASGIFFDRDTDNTDINTGTESIFALRENGAISFLHNALDREIRLRASYVLDPSPMIKVTTDTDPLRNEYEATHVYV